MGLVPWTPEGLSTVAQWHDASNTAYLAFNGELVTYMVDRSGNGRIAYAPATEEPAYDSLQRRIIFSGNRKRLRWNSASFMNTTYMILTVASRPAGGQQYIQAGSSGLANGNLHFGWRSTDVITLDHFGSGLDVSFSVPLDTKVLLAGSLSTSGKNIRGNGSVLGSNAQTSYVTSYDTGSYSWLNGTFFSTALHEYMLVRPYDLTTLQKIEGYLAWKWGLQDSLPATHPYTDAAPMIAADISAEINRGYIVDASINQKNALMPVNPKPMDTVRFSIHSGTAATKKLIIYPNDKLIRGTSFPLILGTNNQAVELTFFDDTAGWMVTG